MNKTKRRWMFPLALIIYAVVFLTGTFFGLRYFWSYIDSYERSRPHIAVDAYMDRLNADLICEHAATLIAQVDQTLQSEDQCKQVIKDAISTEFTTAKKSKECTENKLVYAIMAGKTAIGTVEFTRTGDTEHGFTQWVFSKDEYDLSYLMEKGPSVTVPHNFHVYMGSVELSEQYIVGDPIHYKLFEEFYGKYTLPYQVTYETGMFFGPMELTVTDSLGNPVTAEQLADPDPYISNCSESEITAVNTVTSNFIKHYVAFTTVAGGKTNTPTNYQRLLGILVPGGDLAKRMYAALDGLNWVSDRRATVDDLQIHHYISLGNGRYLCDLTYTVTTRQYTGNIQTATHVIMTFVQTASGLKAESILNA